MAKMIITESMPRRKERTTVLKKKQLKKLIGVMSNPPQLSRRTNLLNQDLRTSIILPTTFKMKWKTYMARKKTMLRPRKKKRIKRLTARRKRSKSSMTSVMTLRRTSMDNIEDL